MEDKDLLHIQPIPAAGEMHEGSPVSLRAENNPEAAAAARARLSILPDPHSATEPMPAPETAVFPQAGFITPQSPLPHPEAAISPLSPAFAAAATNDRLNTHPLFAGAAATPLSTPVPAESIKVPAETPSQPSNPRTRRPIPSRLKPILSAVGSFILLLALFKSQIIFQEIGYLTHSSQTQTAAPATTVSQTEAVPPQPLMTIPKINVNAPMVYAPSTSEAIIQKGLESGVVHYAGTALPGQKGNSVIVGHSSNDWWEPGNYKFVFVLLDKLAVGDRFSVNYNSTKYVYEVAETKVVEPTDLSVLAPTADPEMTIITCTPPGTSWKRLIVRAKQISPAPDQASLAAASAGTSQANALPGSSPTFTQELGGLWHDLIQSVGSVVSGKKADNSAAPSGSPSQLPGI